MKISSLPHLYRNVKRWTEIISVLSKFGLADWIARFNLEFVKDQLKARDGEIIARETPEARIRLALTALGPTFIKLGQLLSTRPDIVGTKLADELTKLQANVAADPPTQVRAMIETELGQPVQELFVEFCDTPIASASIGQVHMAKLPVDDSVVIKVQHPGIEVTVKEDLEVLHGLAQLAERIPEFAVYRPVETVAEMGRTLRRELDFGREERNLQQFAAIFAENPNVRIPKPVTELCTGRVLTMEMIDGVKLSEADRLRATGFDLDEVARRDLATTVHRVAPVDANHAIRLGVGQRREQRALDEDMRIGVDPACEDVSNRDAARLLDRMGQLMRKPYDWADEVKAMGLEAKGMWLVDFDNGEGYYCWSYPEETISHYHGYDEGFAGRIPIQ